MKPVFQVCDNHLSSCFEVDPVVYGVELEQPQALGPDPSAAKSVKDALAAFSAGAVESAVSNRAEAQRFFGPNKFAALSFTCSQI